MTKDNLTTVEAALFARTYGWPGSPERAAVEALAAEVVALRESVRVMVRAEGIMRQRHAAAQEAAWREGVCWGEANPMRTRMERDAAWAEAKARLT